MAKAAISISINGRHPGEAMSFAVELPHDGGHVEAGIGAAREMLRFLQFALGERRVADLAGEFLALRADPPRHRRARSTEDAT